MWGGGSWGCWSTAVQTFQGVRVKGKDQALGCRALRCSPLRGAGHCHSEGRILNPKIIRSQGSFKSRSRSCPQIGAIIVCLSDAEEIIYLTGRSALTEPSETGHKEL